MRRRAWCVAALAAALVLAGCGAASGDEATDVTDASDVPGFGSASTLARRGNAVVDTLTGLTWDLASTGPMCLDCARTACAHRGGRLPTLAELNAILTPGEGCRFSSRVFTYTRCGSFFAEAGTGTWKRPWVVNTLSGAVTRYLDTASHDVRCVKDP